MDQAAATTQDNKNKDEIKEETTNTITTTTPITADGEMPQKKFYRQRAHCNPLAHNDSYSYPITPNDTTWLQEHYPKLYSASDPPVVTILDVGCGFGGLTVALAKLLPSEVIMGLEIRAKVTEYVRLRIVALRYEHNGEAFENCSVMRTNSMKYLPHYFHKASLKKLFFCFPDPHFKRKNWGRRIISERLLSEYAYLLKPGEGRLYCITDVKELHDWHVAKCDAHPLFRRLSEQDCEKDPCVEAMKTETEEAKKVERFGGDNKQGEKYYAVYQRIDDAEIPKIFAENFFAQDDQDDNKNNGDKETDKFEHHSKRKLGVEQLEEDNKETKKKKTMEQDTRN